MNTARSIMRFIAVLAPAVLGASAAGQMTDPTKPPAVVGESGGDSARAPLLQTIVITPTGRWALIDGERVELGGRFRGARVVRINEQEVTLRSGGATEVLKLYPDVRIRSADAPPPAPPRKPQARN